MSYFASVPGGQMPMGGAAAFASTPGGMLNAQRPLLFSPRTPQELQCYETLWVAVNGAGAPSISGAQAVPFFQRSGLDISVLKQVWSLSTPSSTMSKEQFFTAMRLLAIAQRGEQISPDKFFQYENAFLPPPTIQGVQLPQLSGSLGANSGPGAAAGSYSFIEGDIPKYQALFAQYDVDHDGFITGAEAVTLFSQSGLGREALREVWNLADQDKDSKLNVKEFTVAFHLIVCATKRNTPIPQTLPPILKDYLTATTMPAASTAPAPAPGMGVMGGIPQRRPSAERVSMSNLMGDVSITGASDSTPRATSNPSRPPSGLSTPTPADSPTSREMGTVAQELASQARRAVEASSSLSESQSMAYSTLSELLQKLKAEKISLNASIQATVGDSEELADKLRKTTVEIDGLRRELDGMKTRYRELQNEVFQQSRDSGAADKEKEMIVREIDMLRRQLEAINGDRAQLIAKAADMNGRSDQMENQAQAMEGMAAINRHEVATARNDVLMMRSLLSVFVEQRNAAVGDVQGLQNQLRDARSRFERAEGEVNRKQAEIDQLRNERENLLKEKKELAHQLEVSVPASPVKVSHTPAATPSTARAPVAPATVTATQAHVPTPTPAVPKAKPQPEDPTPSKPVQETKTSMPTAAAASKGFDDGFGGFDGKTGPESKIAKSAAPATVSTPVAVPQTNTAKSSSPATAAPAAAFGGFGAFNDASSPSTGAGFDNFGAVPTPTADSFAAFGASDGFGSFPAASANGSGDAAFGGFGEPAAADFGADGFGGFGDFGKGSGSGGAQPAGFDAFDFGSFK